VLNCRTQEKGDSADDGDQPNPGADAVGDFFSPRLQALFGNERFYHRNQCHSWWPIANHDSPFANR
jgi:hypothetical protein